MAKPYYNPFQVSFTDVAGDLVLDLNAPGTFFLNKGSAAAITIAAPANQQDGYIWTFTSTTAFAHVLTFTGAKLQNGVTANRTTATLANVAGSSISFIARNGLWYVLDQSAAVTYA